MRAVFDTNVIIDSFYDEENYSARLVTAAIQQRIIALATYPVVAEYQIIMERQLDNPEQRQQLANFVRTATHAEPQKTDTRIDDQEDRKFIAAALGGQAEFIITSDRHLLDVGNVENIRIVRPSEAWAFYEDNSTNETSWHKFLQGIGIDKQPEA